ncbi:hypothetical protein W97_06972 [Coniosporium apollinis CBS 100218]|uniref:Uncharacterized protein n=1 Tax=Coniosporium apollinis (strain CBS 100218) TaxID=1168221 RepID=R7Z0R1_CONA1|nr:uncharacterized protein W97_06972 [Coniosporium apollinis CBS 100218]EON67604.1 hypothetical protein W97_06972 [Coniosporium apollinis CBS 100218]
MPDGRSKRKDSVDELDELDAALNPARNYPRKRVAVAVCLLQEARPDREAEKRTVRGLPAEEDAMRCEEAMRILY